MSKFDSLKQNPKWVEVLNYGLSLGLTVTDAVAFADMRMTYWLSEEDEKPEEKKTVLQLVPKSDES